MSVACIKYAEVYEYTSGVYNIPNLFLDPRVKSVLTKIIYQIFLSTLPPFFLNSSISLQ